VEMRSVKDEDLSLLEKYLFRIFEFILVPGFFMSTRSFFTGLITIGFLYVFYLLNKAIVSSLDENGVLIYFLTALVLIVLLVITTVVKLSKYNKLKK
jgi:uncharacterized membrane protein